MIEVQSTNSQLEASQRARIAYQSVEPLARHKESLILIPRRKVITRSRPEHRYCSLSEVVVQSVPKTASAARVDIVNGQGNILPANIDLSLDPCNSSLSSDRESPNILKNHSSLSCLVGIDNCPVNSLNRSCNVSPSTSASATTISGPIGTISNRMRNGTKSKNNAFKR